MNIRSCNLWITAEDSNQRIMLLQRQPLPRDVVMDPSLLMTKLYIPPVPQELVSRPRLIEHLASGIHRKLTLVSAPAGFGKTTLLSEWIGQKTGPRSHTQPPFAWLSLDRDDNDPARFWTYVIASLQTIRPDLGESCLRLLQSPSQVPIDSILTTLINDIATKLETFVLALDDYHLIESQSIHEAMTFLLNHLPPNAHMVIAGRADPPLPLAGLRGRGQLNEMRTADLRFTSEEATAFFKQSMALDLSDEDITALENRTEGWIASLQMAGMSMQGRDDITGFINDFSGTHHYIMDYLTEEVLQRQEEIIRTFLLQTSILDRLSGPLCNFIVDQEDCQETLEQLASANLFIVSLDDERGWFRYHQLFADLLRNQLKKTHPDLLPGLHKRASQWFENEGMMAEAVHHALETQDYERAADLIESIAVPLISESRLSAPREWLAKLPSELILTRPWLCVSLASVHLTAGEFDVAEEFLKTAESLVINQKDTKFLKSEQDYARIRGQMIALRATLTSVKGDTANTIELCQQALEELPEDQPTARCLLTWNLGTAHWIKGELSSACRYLDEAIELSQSTDNFFLALVCLGYKADIQAKQGQLHEAAATDRRAIELGTEWGGGDPLPATSFAYISMAQVLYQWNKVDEAMVHLKRGIELSREGADSIVAMMAFPGLALLNKIQDTQSAVSQTLDQAKRIASATHNLVISNMVNAWVARLALARGDLPTAERWAESRESDDLSLNHIPDARQEFAYLTLVRVHMARGSSEEIQIILERLRYWAEAEERTSSVIEILILQSIALHALGKTDLAVQTVEHALSLAEPENYVRIFIDEGKPMQELLRLVALHDGSSNYVRELIKAFKSSTPVDPETIGSLKTERSAFAPKVPYPSIISRPLSARELEVLRLMAAGATSQGIADELFLSVGTVKKHTENIYSKLGVHKRMLAVTLAQELGLL